MAPKNKKEETGELMVSIDQYTRTRDSVILSLTNLQTGLTHVQTGLNDLLRAYMQHTSSILAGEDGDLDKLQLPPNLTATAHAAMEAASTAAANGMNQVVNANNQLEAATAAAADGKNKKRKREKKERDPNAPKKPLTAAFLYAQSARPIVRKDLEAALQPDQVLEKNAVNLEVTKRWNDLPDEEKENWKASYRKSMEAWKVAMAAYLAKSGDKAADVHLDDDASDEGEAEIEAEVEADSDASSEDEDDDEPPKAPSPPAKSARPNKRQKTAAGANGASAANASASTPVPVPGSTRPGATPTAEATTAAAKKDKKKKAAAPQNIAPAPTKELSPEESAKPSKKSKSTRGTRGAEAEVDKENAATPSQEKKKRDRSKRKSEATS